MGLVTSLISSGYQLSGRCLPGMKICWWSILLLLATALPAGAQTFSGISTRWSDSFVEWEIFALAADTIPEEEEASEAPDEELYGEMKLRWLDLREDWSEWDFNLGEERGTIKMKWKDDPSQWELRTFDGAVVTMRAAWNNDFTEWRVTDNSFSLTLRSRWTNQFDEWQVEDAVRGNFYLYTVYRGDPRDWVIEDGLDASVSQQMKLALVFLTIFHSTPRM